MRLYKQLLATNTFNNIINSFYISTPIYYVNATPHIGHLYSSVIADAAQRWQRLTNPTIQLKFVTGTDEHGTKIQQAALKNKTSLPDYCRLISDKYRSLSQSFNIDYTDFIRTTDAAHMSAVQTFWQTIDKNGHIYTAKYGGWYCVSDETFLTDSQLKEIIKPDGSKMLVSAESGHPVEWCEEENYMFKLNKFEDDLKYWLKNEDVVKPKKFHKQLLDLLSEGLPDVSVSRPTSRVHWGIPVPGDPSQTVYVWLDALVNYLTAIGYAASEDYHNFWPADVHVIGKDILKFHGIYWPAFLMAANLEPPRSLFCHSHWTVDAEKMSKSKNNVVCPFDRSEIYSTDGLRYFLLREGVAHSDGNYSDTKVIRILNSELADTFGNLLSRCCGLALNPNQVFPAVHPDALRTISAQDVTKRLMESVIQLPDICYQHYRDYNFYKVVDATIATLHLANLFFETLKPWELKKATATLNQLDVVLHVTLETLRICGIILSPIVPNISDNLLNKINVPKNERHWEHITRTLSWNNVNFQRTHLSEEKIILFKRILIEAEHKKAAKVKK